jgi:hypothetical protein
MTPGYVTTNFAIKAGYFSWGHLSLSLSACWC